MGKRILIISSRPPGHSAGLGQSIMQLLKKDGYEVDFLTKIDTPGLEPQVSTVFVRSKLKVFKDNLKNFKPYRTVHDGFHTLKNLLRKKKNFEGNLYALYYEDEKEPGVPVNSLLEKIQGPYDAVITLFWEGMLNSSSVKAVYDKLKCPVLILSVDMAPMTGGCFYFGNCSNFTNECRDCPLKMSEPDKEKIHQNFILKKLNYGASNCAFLGNTWMIENAKKSGLFKNLHKIELFIDENFFIPVPKKEARKRLNIPDNKDFVILLRSSSEPRKGTKDISAALEKFTATLSPNQRKNLLILTIGDEYFGTVSPDLKDITLELGIVDPQTLKLCYQASDVFINASTDDAGPSMINQSLMCGTPVIGYDNGAALDVIVDGESGFKVKTGDSDDLAVKIPLIYNLSENERMKLSHSSRDVALKHNSGDAFIKNLNEILLAMNSYERKNNI